jgi:hypothetical protein
MIAYEELEKALARWKGRRPDATGASVVAGPPMHEASETTPMAELERTSMGEPSHLGIPTGVATEDSAANESTGEVEVGDSGIVDDDRTNHN